MAGIDSPHRCAEVPGGVGIAIGRGRRSEVGQQFHVGCGHAGNTSKVARSDSKRCAIDAGIIEVMSQCTSGPNPDQRPLGAYAGSYCAGGITVGHGSNTVMADQPPDGIRTGNCSGGIGVGDRACGRIGYQPTDNGGSADDLTAGKAVSNDRILLVFHQTTNIVGAADGSRGKTVLQYAAIHFAYQSANLLVIGGYRHATVIGIAHGSITHGDQCAHLCLCAGDA